MPAPFEGGCRCGAVRYRCATEPARVVHCFCTDCQKLSGAQMSTNLLVPKPSLHVTHGTAAWYVTTGDSGKSVRRHFCAACGSALWSEPELLPELAVVKAGSLDDSSWVRPQACIYVASAPAWAAMPEGLPRFERMPTF
jgi:hypothetical protein